LPENVARAMSWMGGFGEGDTTLAAVGSAERHPQFEDDAIARLRWDADMRHFNADLAELERFSMRSWTGKSKTTQQ
jgi:hypothetical protein